MNLVLLEPDDFLGSGARARLVGRRFAHVVGVHRAGVGDRVRVGLLGGRIGQGTVVALGADSLELEVTLDAEPPPPLAVTLVLALPRPKVLRRVLGTIAAMGVKRLAIVNAARVERSYWESPLLAEGAVRDQLLLGLEQARDTVLPSVTLHPRFRPFVEDELPALVGASRALVAHPGAAAPSPAAPDGAVTLAIGPDGGWVPFEIELLEARGFVAVSLGPRPLRVEQIVPALLGRLTP